MEQGQFYAWISRIAHNLVVDHFKTLRGKCSYDEENQEFADEATLQIACVGREEEMIRLESIEMVQKWIALLPPAQREVVKMRFYQEVPFKEIAEKTGVGISTSLARMRYALHNLRKMAQREGMLSAN